MKTYMLCALAWGLAVIAAGSGQAQVTNVYSNDFSVSAGPEWSSPTIAVSNGESFLGDSLLGFGNGTVTLSLGSLPFHTGATVEFDFYAIESWDGNGPEGGGEDQFKMTADAITRLETNIANYTGANTQAYPNEIPPSGPGGTFAPRTGAFENGHLGFGLGDFGDSTYRFSISFPHFGPNLAVAFTSLQNQLPGDEGWGLDNVRVDVFGVPEPSSLCLGGLAACAVTARRRR